MRKCKHQHIWSYHLRPEKKLMCRQVLREEDDIAGFRMNGGDVAEVNLGSQ